MFDVEHILLANPDDPKIREVTTRMSRHICGLESGQECLTEKAYIVETKIPTDIYRYTPDKVAPKKHVFLITERHKNGSRIYLHPGVIAFVMFTRSPPLDDKTAIAAQNNFLGYFSKRIDGAYTDGNDLLINGKKVMGLNIVYNNAQGTAVIQFILTMRSGLIAASGESFEGRKYKGITGVCDETGIDEDAIRGMVNGFVEIALSWRPEDD